jgi:rhodanese-related sulfurtransferase
VHKLSKTEIDDIQSGKSILIDVRTEDEYYLGHAKNTKNIPLDKISDIKIDKSKKIFVHCVSGNRSNMAESILRKMGYDAKNIGGLNDAAEATGKA